VACGNWSRIDLQAEPGVAYVAIPRAGTGTLRALLRKLHAWPTASTVDFPHSHACTLRELLETHRARRVLVPLRPLHERVASFFERSRRRNCRPPAFNPACAYPGIVHFMPALKQRYLDAGAERFVRWLRGDAQRSVPDLLQPTAAYLNVSWTPNGSAVRFVCTHALRKQVVQALRRWGIPDAEHAWDGVANRHVTNTRVRLSNASLAFLRTRFAEDYALVRRHGCGS